MIDHISFYATNFDATKAFYDAVLLPLGYSCNIEMTASWDEEFPTRRLAAYGTGDQHSFWVIEVHEPASPRHIAFHAASPAAVDAFHTAGVTAGATDNGAPGPRPQYHANYYGAFLLDPDGNNVEAVNHGA